MKRFTDSNKWRDLWFRRLTPHGKLAYMFLLDAVDNAGVWEPDFDLADFQIGEPLNWIAVQQEFGDRLHVLASGKWLLTRFIAFQFGELREDCKPHQQVVRLIEQHGIGELIKGYSKGIHAAKDKEKDKDKDKDQEKDTDKEKDKDSGESQFEAVWSAFPKKTGKKEARPQIVAAIKAKGFEPLLERVQAYAAAVARWPEADRCFVPDPVRWFKRGHYDDDPAAWERKAPNTGAKLTFMR